MKQNDILMIAGIGALGLAAYTMMGRNNQQQQPIIIPYPQPQPQLQPSTSNTSGGSSAPSGSGGSKVQNTLDKISKGANTANDIWGAISNIFKGVPVQKNEKLFI